MTFASQYIRRIENQAATIRAAQAFALTGEAGVPLRGITPARWRAQLVHIAREGFYPKGFE